MTVKLITFKTNHTILGEVKDIPENDYVEVKDCVQIISVPPTNQNPQGGVSFVPFVEYAKEFKTGFKIKRQDILMINEPILEVENQYNKIFGSGIQIASNNFKL